jgi:predicted nuclease of predicted toxin-antitoxin system
MGTLASELGPHVDHDAVQPRIYADANLPVGIVAFMREQLKWDVFFVLEHADLRRARDTEHYRLARQLRRTLVSLDRDYFDDKQFPHEQSGGVLVMSAPDEDRLRVLLVQANRVLFGSAPVPSLSGRKLRWDYGADAPVDL